MTTPYNMNVQDILNFFKKPLWADPNVSAGITPTMTLAPLNYLQDLPAEVRNGVDLSGLTTGASAADLSKVFPNFNGTGGAPTSFMDKMLGYEGKNGYVPGWGGMALSAASGIGQSLMAMKQYGLMEDQLKEQKRQFDINYGMQRKSFNNQLEDRQRARVASNPGAYESVSDYMKKYGA